ncbi:response regulator [Microbacterium azadirachtae]|jgi:response regulator of citrate/malate metabolism|uniref:Transcriptional regulatory protein n=1 Tax=Microbacterium azadirachtae TaxID=582680 RepID=A0A1I6GDU6_9MICO|nr:response regulator [Microbacterium azadirachtae]SFR40300.1 Response regulator of citrate/malate metabolism [Microbacterium azadirachtae]
MIGVLIVDDDPLTLELHTAYVERLDGFAVVGECTGVRAALTALAEVGDRIDLVLLDITMPDGSGIDVLRQIRAADADIDVIAVTSVREVDAVRRMSALGVAQYLLKPFPFRVFRERMEQYAERRARAIGITGAASQDEIDALVGGPPTGAVALPKGLTAETLQAVTAALRAHGELSAGEAAPLVGVSRVTARRYLEHLVDARVATRAPRYGTPGRPETAYRLAGAGS